VGSRPHWFAFAFAFALAAAAEAAHALDAAVAALGADKGRLAPLSPQTPLSGQVAVPTFPSRN